MADSTYVIAVDKAALEALKTKYVNLYNALKTKLAYDPATGVYLSTPFSIYVGGSQFTEAQHVVAAIDGVRTKLVERLTLTQKNSDQLRQGLAAVLADSEAVEELNKMTGAEFEAFIPTSVK